jgi:hypothetical protein
MRNFLCGLIVGLGLSGSVVLAGNLYDPQGNLRAPAGSQQQYDYFRQRQQQLDIGALRRHAEEDRAAGRVPCAK